MLQMRIWLLAYYDANDISQLEANGDDLFINGGDAMI